MSNALADLLEAREIVLLDGATGTELERRGFRAPLPVWTGDAAIRAPELLQQVHRDYLDAGADIVTANTFRTTPYTMRPLGRESDAGMLTSRSVELARAACDVVGHGLVAGCIAPLEDCYHPERVPAPEIARYEHMLHVRNLADAGPDLLLVETMGTSREAHAAAEAALASGLPVLVSFILDPSGAGDLLSGEDLEVAMAHLRALDVGGRRVAGFLVNCTPRDTALRALDRIALSGDPRPIGAYANLGAPDAAHGWSWDASATPESYAAWGVACRERGARLLGGCCGTTPDHIRALARAVRPPTR